MTSPARDRPLTWVRRWPIAVAMALVVGVVPGGAVGASPAIEPSPAAAPGFVAVGTAPLRDPLGLRTATRLPDGRILVIDGKDAQLWDPASGAWAPAGSLQAIRDRAYAAVPLADGRVVVVGGYSLGRISGGKRLRHPTGIEVWDPATRSFSILGRLPTGRGGVRRFPLADGRVLIVGGTSNALHHRDVLAWDPTDGRVTKVARLPRTTVSSGEIQGVVLPDASLILTGGSPEDPVLAVLVLTVDPASGDLRVIHQMPGHGPVMPYALADGRLLLVAEGRELACPLLPGETCEGIHTVAVLDPTTGAATELARGEGGLRSVQLADGSVMLVEETSEPCVDVPACLDGNVRRWDPTSGDLVTLGTIPEHLSNPVVTTLSDGTVLVIGDETAWRIDPATNAIDPAGPLPPLDPYTREVVALLDGRALLLDRGEAVWLWAPPVEG